MVADAHERFSAVRRLQRRSAAMDWSSSESWCWMGADDMEQLASAPPSARRSVPILMYHSISARASSSFADFAVPPARFAEQVQAVREAGFRAVTIGELADMEAGATVAHPAAGRPDL